MNLNEKIEERNEDLVKLRKKITGTVQVLTHVKEKLQFVQASMFTHTHTHTHTCQMYPVLYCIVRQKMLRKRSVWQLLNRVSPW